MERKEVDKIKTNREKERRVRELHKRINLTLLLKENVYKTVFREEEEEVQPEARWQCRSG